MFRFVKTMIDYPWHRYWHKSHDVPRTSNGFTYVLDKYESICFPFETFSIHRCLVLLGEPGIGKSAEIERIAKVESTDDRSRLYVNLNSIGSEASLMRKVFDSEKVNEWKASDYDFFLYLDSLDEALLNINTLSGLLADEIRPLPTNRLYIRVACRSGEWANFSTLNNQLTSQWESAGRQLIQLAPLTSEDVQIAAVKEEVDAERFLTEIFTKNIQPLAAKPVTLKLLLNLFKSADGLPSIQFAVYERGCLALCGDDYEGRPTSRYNDELTNEQRFRIAARIAAVMIFSNKSSIWIGNDTGEHTDADILVSDLSDFEEFNKDHSSFRVSEKNIRETISKGLFRGDGTKRIKFSHQTFAEFLATWYLDYREVPDDDVIRLLGDANPHPQLYEASAWIAGRRESIFFHLAKVAPLVLLRSDVLSANDDLRFELTEKLLTVFEREEALDREVRFEFQKLAHPKLEAQLRPYIVDTTKGWLVRRVAIDIAELCEVRDLQDALLSVVLDRDEFHATRVNAAYAIKRIGDDEAKLKLKPLVWSTYDGDENLELKGVAMSALWKEQLSTLELFDAYKNPTPSFLGSYKSFLYGIIHKFDTEDFVIALEWLGAKCRLEGHFSYDTERLASEIVTEAWNHLDDQNVFDRFVKTLLPYLKTHRQGISGRYEGEIKVDDPQFHSKRRRVLLALMPLLNERDDWIDLSLTPVFNFNLADAGWVIQSWLDTSDSVVKERLADLLKSWVASTHGYYSKGAEPDFLDEIHRAMLLNNNFFEAMHPLFKAIEFGTDAELAAKEQYQRWLEMEIKWRRHQDEPVLEPPPKERVLSWLSRFENGETDGWWMLNREMTTRPNSLVYGDEFEADLEQLPGWQEADASTKDRIVDAARKYTLIGDPQDESWLGKNVIQFSAFAGYRALKLLIKHDAAFVDALSAEDWNRWIPIVYFYPVYNSAENGALAEHQHLLKRAYDINPHLFETLVSYDIEKAVSHDNSFLSFDKLELCWDAQLIGIWRKNIDSQELPTAIRLRIFEQLFELKDEETISRAITFIDRSLPDEINEQTLYSGLMQILIRFGIQQAWPRIWTVLNENVAFGKSVLESGVSRFGGVLFDQLSESELGNLYLWLATNYPHSEDPDFSGESMAHFVGPREEMGRWRDLALDKLKYRGTEEAVRSIEKIVQKLPSIEWLKFTLIDAKHRMHERSWKPLSLSQLLDTLRIKRESSTVTTVLFFAANPKDAQTLSIDEEIRAIQSQVRASEFRKSIHIESRWAVQPTDVLQALNEVEPHIVHFSGHGTNTDEIVFQDANGDAVVVKKDAIIKSIASSAKNIRIIVFNTCFSNNQAESITKHIDCAIGMNDSISDKAARVFAAQFYSSIGFGHSVKVAYDQAKAALMLEGIPEEDTPQLYVKQGVNPEQIVLIHD